MRFKEWKLSLVEGKNLCWWCHKRGEDNSGDNFHYYGEGNGGYCFSCENKLVSDEYKPESELEEEWDLSNKVEFNEEVYNTILENTSPNGRGYRGLDSKVLAKTGVRYSFNTETGEVGEVYYPVTENTFKEGVKGLDALTGYKVRRIPKNFLAIGKVGKDSEFFLQHMFPTHKGWLLIVEGENDALAAYQMLYKSKNDKKYDEIAVVSPVTGSGGIVNALRANYEWVDQFSRIIVCMDNDRAGKAATEKAMEVLPKNKSYVVNLRRKDVHEFLEKGDEKSFLNDFWGMKPYVVDGVKSSFDGFLEITDQLDWEYMPLPPYMKKLQENMGGGITKGSINNIIAATSVSKTTHLRNIVYHWIFNTRTRPVIVSLEETAAEYSLNLLQVHLKENFFGKTPEEIKKFLEQEYVQDAIKQLSLDEEGQPRFYLIDERSGSIEDIEKQIELLHSKYGCNVFIFDVLSDLLRGSNADKAEDHMSFQREMCKRGATFINTHHTRKMPLSKDGKTAEPTEWDVLGTGSFIQSAHTNILFYRDKTDECTLRRNTTRAVMSKRRGGVTGDAGEWFYDFKTLQCYDLEEYLEDNPHMAVTEK